MNFITFVHKNICRWTFNKKTPKDPVESAEAALAATSQGI
jgi:hypothetical protein